MGIGVREVELTTSLGDIPEGICEVCGSRTRKEFIEHAVNGDLVIVRTRVAGYRCVNCGVASYSHKGIAESLEQAKKILLDEGDTRIANLLDESIGFHRSFVSS